VVPGFVHHITQRGNRRQQAFFNTETIEAFRKHERTGRPVGDNGFIEKMEKATGGRLKPGKPGPKPRISMVSPELPAQPVSPPLSKIRLWRGWEGIKGRVNR